MAEEIGLARALEAAAVTPNSGPSVEKPLHVFHFCSKPVVLFEPDQPLLFKSGLLLVQGAPLLLKALLSLKVLLLNPELDFVALQVLVLVKGATVKGATAAAFVTSWAPWKSVILWVLLRSRRSAFFWPRGPSEMMMSTEK